jgi:hypothetical protein
VSPKSIKLLSALSLATVVAVTGYVPVANAFNFGDMMNPSRWMGGGRNRDRDGYGDEYGDDYGPYGGPWGGGPYGGGPYGGAPYGGYGYGAPGYGVPGGYGAPGYGAPGGYGAPAYGAPIAAPAAPAAQGPSSSGGGNKAEIDALKRRIDELESQQRPAQPSSQGGEWPSAPAFRPMNQY